MTYEKTNADGTKVYSSCKVIQLGDTWVSNPTAEQIAAAGWVEHVTIVNEPTEDDVQMAEYQQMLEDSREKMLSLIEGYFATNGSGEIQELASERQEIRYQLDQIGKIVQTPEGTGTPFDPYKYWKEGMAVKAGEWWQTEDSHIWQAVKDGVPASSTDSEYWEIS